MSNLLSAFKAARKVGTPLVAIATPDPAATIETLQSGFEENPPALIQWDVVRGLTALNSPAQSALAGLGSDIAAITQNPVEALAVATRLPERAILFLHNAQRFVDQPAVAQAVWNLRDLFKSNKRTLTLLCPGMTLPAELAQDVLTLTEELPGIAELETILKAQYTYAQEAVDLPELAEETVRKAVDATIGLAAFPAEQAIAMSISPEGLDVSGLWERKRQMIAQTPGLTVWRGGETFADIGGVENAKTFLTRLVNGKEPPRDCLH